jgi:hypothetical protein
MYIIANSMPIRPRRPQDLVPALRTVQIGFRISSGDARFLSKLAREADVGHLTLARLVLEHYLAEQRTTTDQSKGRSR